MLGQWCWFWVLVKTFQDLAVKSVPKVKTIIPWELDLHIYLTLEYKGESLKEDSKQ